MEPEHNHIRHLGLKNLARNSLSKLGLNLTYALTPGVSILGLNIFRDDRPGPYRYRSSYALDHVLARKPGTVLDVGSGGGHHARQFADAGCDVLCVDFGTSVYAQDEVAGGVRVEHVDFNRFEPSAKFDLVWASHVVEHQRNVGAFIERLIKCCASDGQVCITVPDPHRNLWGGHLTLWTPGLLAYNVVLCGVDISDADLVRGSGEFSLIFSPKRMPLPAGLTFDYGDLDQLAPFLPQGWHENSDPWSVRYVHNAVSKPK